MMKDHHGLDGWVDYDLQKLFTDLINHKPNGAFFIVMGWPELSPAICGLISEHSISNP